MSPDIFPREVSSEPVHFRTVVSDEEYEILGGEVPRPASASQITRLDDLHRLRSSDMGVRWDEGGGRVNVPPECVSREGRAGGQVRTSSMI